MKRYVKAGEFLARRRARQGFSQETIARKMRCTTALVSQWENWRRVPVTTDMTRLADTLDIGASALIDLLRMYGGER